MRTYVKICTVVGAAVLYTLILVIPSALFIGIMSHLDQSTFSYILSSILTGVLILGFFFWFILGLSLYPELIAREMNKK